MPPNAPPIVDARKPADFPCGIDEVSTALCKTVTDWVTVVVVGEYDRVTVPDAVKVVMAKARSST
jgi:hypothetical protein